MKEEFEINREINVPEGYEFLIKGSGTSACLLTGKLQDELEFISMRNIPNIRQIGLAGLFAVAVSQKDEEMEEIDVWGTFDSKILHQPTPLQWGLGLERTKINLLSCGWNHALFSSNLGIFGTGENKFGQLNANNKCKFFYDITHVWPNDCQPITSIAAGFRQSYWAADGKVWGCGESKNFELGISQNKKNQEPMIIEYRNQEKAIILDKIVCGKKFAILLSKNTKQVYGIGSNNFGVLLEPEDEKFVKSISRLTIKDDVIDIEAGWSHSVFLHENGEISTFGRNNFNQLGRAGEQNPSIPEKCISICSGTQFSFAISQTGKLYGWGWNQHMNIANNSEEKVKKPIPIDTKGMKVIQCITYPAITILKVQSKGEG